MSKSVLVTGANGFVGRHLLEVAKSYGFAVHAGVRKSSNTKSIDHLDVPIHRLTYEDRDRLSEELKAIGPFDYIIHNGGVTQAIDLEIYRRGNVSVTENLLVAAKKSGTLMEQFVYVSSLAARGPSYLGQDAPISDYGISKLEAEAKVRGSRLDFVIIRPTAVYGSGDHGFLELVKIVKSHVFLTLGSKRQRLTMIHGHDLARLVYDHLDSVGNTIYGWDGKIYSQKDLNEAIKKGLGIGFVLRLQIGVPILKTISYIMNGIYKLLFRKAWHYNPKKMKELVALDWSVHEGTEPQAGTFVPQFDIERGFQEAIDYYKAHSWI